MTAAERALDFVKAGDRVGLGTGHAASAFAKALAGRVRDGLEIRAVPTSEATAEQARALGIPLATLDEIDALDVTFDGADEVDPRLDLIKGYGGALVRERVVASVSERLVILVGREKLVPVLGTRGALPVEVVPFALSTCRRVLDAMGFPSVVRLDGGRPFLTDNGNFLLHVQVAALADPAATLARLRTVPGIVDAGLFLGLASIVIVDDGDHVEVLRRES
ncbi:MAG: ribose-5-phosphate isomerase RpiA [Bacteroidales bacterium]